MTRTMGDATHANVAALAAVPGLQLVAGYVTGSADIVWTALDWARFPRQLRITIDQGNGVPVPSAIVRDVEPGAWSPQAAVNRTGWIPATPQGTARPTIYCDRNDLSREGGVLQSGWRGDLWLAYPGWQVGQPLPTAPGCTYVAVQNQLNVGNAYDLSVVLDPFWPLGGPVINHYQPGSVFLFYTPAGQLQLAGIGQDNALWVSDLDPVTKIATNQRAVTFPLTFA